MSLTENGLYTIRLVPHQTLATLVTAFFLEQQGLPLLEKDQTREQLKHIGVCDLVAHHL